MLAHHKDAHQRSKSLIHCFQEHSNMYLHRPQQVTTQPVLYLHVAAVHQLLVHHKDAHEPLSLATATAAAVAAFPAGDDGAGAGAGQRLGHAWPSHTDIHLDDGEGGAEQQQQQQRQEDQQGYGIVPPTQTLLERMRLKQLQVG